MQDLRLTLSIGIAAAVLVGCQALQSSSPPTRHKGVIVVFAQELEFLPTGRNPKLGWPWPVVDNRSRIRAQIQLLPVHGWHPPHAKMFYLDCVGIATPLPGEHNRRHDVHRLEIHEVLEVREPKTGD
jgi:hypothetical protein